MEIRYLLLLFAIIISVNSCNEEDKAVKEKEREAKKILFIGGNIYEAKKELEKEGFEVGKIEDITKTGESLSMLIEFKELSPSALDVIGYASGVDLEPWKKRELNYIVVESNIEGEIVKIEAK